MLILFIATISGRALGLDFGLAPGLSIKNALLYATVSIIAIESATARNRKVELVSVFVPYGLLILYAFLSWLFLILFLDNPQYSPVETFIRLKVKLVDQALMLLVFFYGVVNWKDALWLLKALIWVVLIGCLITVLDSFDIPDLGIITARRSDGRVEGIIGSAQEFGGLLAFFLPAAIALWWTKKGIARFLALLGIAMMLISVMLSASRGAMLGIVAGSLFAAIYLRKHISARILLRATLAAITLGAVALVVVLSTQFGQLLEERLSTGIATGDVETLSSGRTKIWSAAWNEMAEYPVSFISGLGWEAYYESMGYRYATHSVYLDRLYNLGIIGLALFIVCFTNAIAVVRRGLVNAPEQTVPFLIATVIGMTSFLIAMAFSDLHTAGIFIWGFAGLALRIAVNSSRDATRQPQS